MWHQVGLFTVVFAVSAALPGPDTMLLFSRALGSGARSAVPVALGLTVGKLDLLTAAVAGVTAAAAALGPVFIILKLAGSAYVLWLAVKLWRRAGHANEPEPVASSSRLAIAGSGWRGVGLGAVLTVSNPQALLFYIAVLPSVLGSARRCRAVPTAVPGARRGDGSDRNRLHRPGHPAPIRAAPEPMPHRRPGRRCPAGIRQRNRCNPMTARQRPG